MRSCGLFIGNTVVKIIYYYKSQFNINLSHIGENNNVATMAEE
jgi:hypothetical protein